MSQEDKKPNTEQKSDQKKEKKAPKAVRAKVIKAKWTLERCQRFARRYSDESTWASCSSASYKAACAHGWKEQCLAEQNSSHSSEHSNMKKASGH